MATVTIITTFPDLKQYSMASRRPALASIPNAINSPLRAAAIAGKRTRAQSGDTRDASLHDQPPAKRQAVEIQNVENRPLSRRPLENFEDQFSKRGNVPTALERRLHASREKKVPAEPEKQQTTQPRLKADDLENLRQWQRHYRRQFPQFVFYLDSVADDVRVKVLRQIHSLGAREEKFFSKAVTHVVTTRSIPDVTSSKTDGNQQSRESTNMQADSHKTTTMLDSTLQRRTQLAQSHGDARRFAVPAADVLTRARELNIKIWTQEKLQRVLKSMLDTDTGEPMHDANSRATKANRHADLEQLLRHEKINGPADRDMNVLAQDMCSFKGCYIYIHDMDERTRPVMVRDYPKPSSKESGKWPQFRLSAVGRCPFVEDPSQTKQQQELERKQAKQKREQATLKRARGSINDQITAQPLAERDSNLRRSPRKLTQDGKDLAKPLDPPKLVPTKRQSSTEDAPVFGSAQINLRGLPRMIGGVPVASGMQHSNVTSAIKSQAISSAAISSTAPGMTRRVTDSKEVLGLKRKVLERGASANSQPPSSYMNDVRAAINEEAGPPARAAKRRAQENILGAVPEDEAVNAVTKHRKSTKKAKVERDPKAGYCENCHDKFDDFEEHCNSRKHMKFARTADNWKELDNLLEKLKRPRKTA